MWGCSAAGRAPALQEGGQEVDSPHVHQVEIRETLVKVLQFSRCLIFEVREGRQAIRGYSSAGRAPALQAGGQRFDPAYLHQWLEGITEKPEIWAYSSAG